MEKVFYYLFTFFESALSVVGIRATYEKPRYAVVERLDRGVEVRAYEPRVAVETDARGQRDGEAFGRLFRYITGANRGGARIAMTIPVEQGAGGTMRFYLPQKVVEAGVPEPTEPGVRIVRIPQEQLAVLRFSGSTAPEVRRQQSDILTDVLDKAGKRTADPPFSIPFLRRNEVAVRLPSSDT